MTTNNSSNFSTILNSWFLISQSLEKHFKVKGKRVVKSISTSRWMKNRIKTTKMKKSLSIIKTMQTQKMLACLNLPPVKALAKAQVRELVKVPAKVLAKAQVRAPAKTTLCLSSKCSKNFYTSMTKTALSLFEDSFELIWGQLWD